MYRKKLFNIDNENPQKGYTDGETWNGWECPLFEKTEADKIITYCNLNGIKSYFDITADTYYIEIANTLEAYKGRNIIVNNIIIHVYDIGNGCLCWSKSKGVMR